VVHAVDPTAYDEGGSETDHVAFGCGRALDPRGVADAEQRGLDLTDEAAAFADELGHDVAVELLYGNPVAEIADYAESEGFDTIFVGHRGRSERAGLMLGSVAKSIVERATVPVTVVR